MIPGGNNKRVKREKALVYALVLKKLAEDELDAAQELTGEARTSKLRVALYNAAAAYGLVAESSGSGDFDISMASAQTLEDAADAWAARDK